MSATHGGMIIAERLQAHGVQHFFTLCGGHIAPMNVAAKQLGMQIVDVRDEASAVFGADAISRMTGGIGVAAVTAGPGVTNTVTAVKNAQMAQSPVLIFGGATPTILMGRGSLQDIDQMELMRPLTKWCTSVRTVRSLGSTVDKAIKIAKEGVPGPVFIEVPIDVLYPEHLVHDMYMDESGLENPEGLAENALKMYLNAHLKRQFHQPEVPVKMPRPSLRKMVSNVSHAAQIKRVRAALKTAERPVLVLGSQTLVNRTPEEAERIADAVRALGIPVWLGGMARGLLGRRSDIQFRHKRTAALKEADVAIVMGFPFDFRLAYGRSIASDAKLIAVNLSMRDLTKNRVPDIPVLAHPGDVLEELAGHNEDNSGRWDAWFERLRAREDARDEDIREQGTSVGEKGVNPIAFFLKMEEAMADKSTLVVDGGDFVGTGAYTLRPRGPLSWLDPGVFGTLGVGGGFTVGAALARPENETWLIYGDGSSAYSLAEIDTCVRVGVAPIIVIGTDASWGQIARDQVTILGDDAATTLLFTDYHTVAEGYGGVGILVTDIDQVDDALKAAKEHAAAGRPVCLNVHLSPSNFREGSISM